MQGADPYMRKFGHINNIQRRIFAAMLSNLDDSVGSILKKLRQEGLEENTLIFFISDNGGPTRELTSSNLPLRDGKGSVYEGGIRIPYLVQWKGKLPEGSEYDKPVISLDIFSTAAAVANAEMDKRKTIDGVNLLPYLTGENKGRPHDQLFWRISNRTAIRAGDWKLLRNPGRGQDGAWELYNLADDLSETNNLASSQPTKLKEMIKAWESMNGEMIDPVWNPRG